VSLRERAKILAAQAGVSLNHFISLAVAEKISRLESEANGSSGIARQLLELNSSLKIEYQLPQS
jgi:hypothetical protein